MSTDVSSLLTRGVREVVPVLLRRQLSYTFGELDCHWQLEGPGHALQASFHRQFLGATELLKQGFLAFHAAAKPNPTGGCSLRLHVGGTGPVGDGDTLDRVLRGLALTPVGMVHPPENVDAAARAAHNAEPGAESALAMPRRSLRRAQGLCPAISAQVEFSCLPAAGFLFRTHYLLRDAHPGLPEAAHGALQPATSSALWLVHADRVNAGSVIRQAQAFGWEVTAMASLEEAARRLRHRATALVRPAMVMVFACDGAPPSALHVLRGLLPAQVHFVYAVEVGSIWWRDGLDGSLPADCELCCHPLSNSEWSCWSRTLRGPARAIPAAPPAPVQSAGRLPVLVVDDDEFCRELAQALLDALGYEARVAHNGQEAIDSCRADPPALVLMDLDMPQVDGFEATRRLRAMQQAGELPPFRVLATSSAPDRSWIAEAMLAGSDAFVPKPLRVETLRGELARWCAARTASLLAGG